MQTGPERIQHAIEKAQHQGRSALLVKLPMTSPVPLVELARITVSSGADMIEVGAPLGTASRGRALLASLSTVANSVGAPLLWWMDADDVHMLTQGEDRLSAADFVAAGFAGVVIAAPPDARQSITHAFGDTLAPIYFFAPMFPAEHWERACEYSRGFIYGIGLPTGPPMDGAVATKLAAYIDITRQRSGLPVIVGAGVSTPEQAAFVGSIADGVAVAKAVISVMHEALAADGDVFAEVGRLVSSLHDGLVRRGGSGG